MHFMSPQIGLSCKSSEDMATEITKKKSPVLPPGVVWGSSPRDPYEDPHKPRIAWQ